VLASRFWMIVRRVRPMRYGRFHASRLRQFPLPSERSSATPLCVQAIVRCAPHRVVCPHARLPGGAITPAADTL
jgi:hypothetical protein